MCNVPCELCADLEGCDISCYCENNWKYYCCAKDDCKPDKNYYPDKDCKHIPIRTSKKEKNDGRQNYF